MDLHTANQAGNGGRALSDAPAQPKRRPLPLIDVDTAPFWEATQAGRLVAQRCAGCRAMRFPPRMLCSRCRSWDSEWVELDGSGTVYSWVVVVHPVTEGLRSEVPYVIALVEVAPGVRMPARLVGCDPAEISAGLPVVVEFEAISPDVTLPVFRPVKARQT